VSGARNVRSPIFTKSNGGHVISLQSTRCGQLVAKGAHNNDGTG
jgi:hypothetical protein